MHVTLLYLCFVLIISLVTDPVTAKSLRNPLDGSERRNPGANLTEFHFGETHSRLNSKAPGFLDLKNSNLTREKSTIDEPWLSTAIDDVVQQSLLVDQSREPKNISFPSLADSKSAVILHRTVNGSIVKTLLPIEHDDKTSSILGSRWTYTPSLITTPRRRTPAGFWTVPPSKFATTTNLTPPIATRLSSRITISSKANDTPLKSPSSEPFKRGATTPSEPSTTENREILDKFRFSTGELTNKMTSGNVDSNSFHEKLKAVPAAAGTTPEPSAEPAKSTDWWLKHPDLEFAELSDETYEDDDTFYGDGPLGSLTGGIQSHELSPPPGHPSFLHSQSKPTSKTTSATTSPTRIQTTNTAGIKKSSPTRRQSFHVPPFTSTSTTTQLPMLYINDPEDAGITMETTTPESSEPTTPADSDDLSYIVINIWNYVNGELTLMGQQTVSTATNEDEVTNSTKGSHEAKPATLQLPQSILDQLAIPYKSTTTAVPTTSRNPYTLIPPLGGVGNPEPVGSFKPNPVTPPTYYDSPSAHLKPSQSYDAPPTPAPPKTSYNHGTPSPFYGPPPMKYISQNYGPPVPLKHHNNDQEHPGNMQTKLTQPSQSNNPPRGGFRPAKPEPEVLPFNPIASQSTLALYGFNSPPLNAILPDFIVDSINARPHPPSPASLATESRFAEPLAQFPGSNSGTFSSNDPKVTRTGFYRPSDPNFHKSQSHSRSNVRKDSSMIEAQTEQRIPVFERVIEPQMPSDFYTYLASTGKPSTESGGTDGDATSRFPHGNGPDGKPAETTAPRGNEQTTSQTTTTLQNTPIPITTTVTTKASATELKTQNNGNRNSLVALGLSMLPTLVLALPAIGRRRRNLDLTASDWSDQHSSDNVLKYLGEQGLQQMIIKGIPIRDCQPVTYPQHRISPNKVLICPGTSPRAMNMIIMN